MGTYVTDLLKTSSAVKVTPRGSVGAPTTGTWEKGDMVLDSNAALWVCSVAGTPGTWVEKGNAGAGTGHTIQDEGGALTQRTYLNFAGAGVTATDDAGNDATLITIPGAAGSGITTLNGLTDALQTLSDVDDTNVTLAISSGAAAHTFTMGWVGQLAVARGGTGAATAQGARVSILPSLTGNAGLFLRVNVGETDVEWATGGSTPPGGLDKQIQFNDSSLFGGNSNFTFDKATSLVDLKGILRFSGSMSGYIQLTASSTSGSSTLTLPPSAPASNGQVLTGLTDGTLYWSAGGGSGVSSLNGLSDSVQTFADVDDTNVTLFISSALATHTFTVGWIGELSTSRGGTGFAGPYNQYGLIFADTVNSLNSTAAGAVATVLHGNGIGSQPTFGNIVSADFGAGTLDISHGGTGSSTALAARLGLLPSISGNSLKYLRVNAGEFDVEWAAGTGGGGSPGGVSGDVQFNDGGFLGGDSGFRFDKTTDAVDIAGALKIKTLLQTTMPTDSDFGANSRMIIWIDSDDSNRVYLMFRRGTGDIVSIELA